MRLSILLTPRKYTVLKGKFVFNLREVFQECKPGANKTCLYYISFLFNYCNTAANAITVTTTTTTAYLVVNNSCYIPGRDEALLQY